MGSHGAFLLLARNMEKNGQKKAGAYGESNLLLQHCQLSPVPIRMKQAALGRKNLIVIST